MALPFPHDHGVPGEGVHGGVLDSDRDKERGGWGSSYLHPEAQHGLLWDNTGVQRAEEPRIVIHFDGATRIVIHFVRATRIVIHIGATQA